jgi:hypothetical protein
MSDVPYATTLGMANGSGFGSTWNTSFVRLMQIAVSFIGVAIFRSADVDHLYFGTSMPFEEGATIPLNLAEWLPPVLTALKFG